MQAPEKFFAGSGAGPAAGPGNPSGCLGEREVPVFGPDSLRQAVLIIDAGHGGEDGGAVSVTGTRESDLNLSVAKRVDALAGSMGFRRYFSGTATGRSTTKKPRPSRKEESDLKNRVQTVEETEGAMLLSIHQNSYPDSRYRGAQVFYSNEALSSQWAELTQNLLRAAWIRKTTAWPR